MPTTKFSVIGKKYTETFGDYVILAWLDAKTPLFDKRLVPGKYNSFKPGKKGEHRIVSTVEKDNKRLAVCVQRLDRASGDLAREVKKMVASAISKAAELKLKRVVVFAGSQHEELCLAVQEGALLGGYTFNKYLSSRKRAPAVQLISNASRNIFKEGNIVAKWANFARDTLNEPPGVINPVTLSEAYKIAGKESGLKIDVWGPKKLESENCGGILAVGSGSSTKPRLVIGHYNPAGATTHLALVGKGITFDSGGYSLKPSKSMEEMKMDMGGAAMMFGAACAIAELQLPIKISVYCPLAHNAISSTAYNVSDIVTTRSGKTIEVLNTDAEGRIILSDALDLACEEKPDFLIDSATLTGSAVMALGEDIAAIYGTDPDFNSQLLEASKAAGENLWEMPLHMPYDGQLDSDIADVRNIGERWGGSITAALFLKHFVKKVDRWIHMDIAGPGCKTTPLEHLGKGAKGFGIKTIVELAKKIDNI